MITIKVPGSKSYTNRALVLAALASGVSTLKGALISDDTKYMMDALKAFGVGIEIEGENIKVNGGVLKAPAKEIFCGNSGTCMRFLSGVMGVLGIPCTLTGDKRMQERPILDLIDALKFLGCNISSKKGFPPVQIAKPKNPEEVGGEYEMTGDVSSQFISAILLAAPYATKNIVLRVNGPLTSKSYIYMTLRVMNVFKVRVSSEFEPLTMCFKIAPKQNYSPVDYEIEGDASSATYFWALAKLLNKEVEVTNISTESLQGDFYFKTLIEGFKPGEFDMNDMPDSVPTLAVFAAFQKGKTVIKNAENLRLKECDRLRALSTELKKIGCDCSETNDGLIINGDSEKLHGASINTYNDHRIAMSFALAKAKISGIVIENPSCVSKTYPNFWDDYAKLA